MTLNKCFKGRKMSVDWKKD